MPKPSRFRSSQNFELGKRTKLKRLALRSIGAVLLTFAIVASILAYRIHTGNASMAKYPIPLANAPDKSTSILIFSPHPDDETLGTSGLIQSTLRAGGKVHVVFMTNGDAFRVGVSDYYKVLPVKPSDCINYGKMRQKEALGSLETLGLKPADVTFLGFSDRGLMRMWENWWLPSNPWTSYYTHASAVVYPNSPAFQCPESGVSVLAAVEAEIAKYHPTDIYTTHPTDDHPDHSASASFVVAAMHTFAVNGNPWIDRVHLHFFLIHRGDWPVPEGYHSDLPLRPPSAFLGLDTRWNSLGLNELDRTVKYNALRHYVSQEEMMGDFLNSFVRANELFGELPESASIAPNVNNEKVNLDGTPQSWPTHQPVAQDPTGDTVIRDFQSGGDIVAIYAAHDAKNIYLRMDTHSHLSPEINYRLMIRPFDSKMRTIPKVLIISFSPRSLAENTPTKLIGGSTLVWQNNCIEATLPVKSVEIKDPNLLFIEGKTTFSQVIVDHTGYRTVILGS